LNACQFFFSRPFFQRSAQLELRRAVRLRHLILGQRGLAVVAVVVVVVGVLVG
jgi:hypothetical protein